MRVAIRTDASHQIGTGHVMRCLTLAKKLKAAGAEVQFICRDHAGDFLKEINSAGFDLTVLNTDSDYRVVEGGEYALWLGVSPDLDAAQVISELRNKSRLDWMVVDHYGLDRRWEEAVRDCAENIMVIDDLANREHDCDLILDQNLYENMSSRYDDLVPPHCVKKLGPEHALLRDEFFKEREKLKSRGGGVKRVFLFYGGSDSSGETLKALEAIIRLDETTINFDIVVGRSNDDKDKIKALCSRHENLTYHCQVSNMAQLIAGADLALGAGGTTTYERYCLGLPTIVTAVANNQVEAAEFACKSGLNYYLGTSADVTHELVRDCLKRLLCDNDAVRNMSRKLMNIFDGGKGDIVECLLFEKA